MLEQNVLALHLMRLKQSQQALDGALEDLTRWLMHQGTSSQTSELLDGLQLSVAQVAIFVERLSRQGSA